MICFSKCHGKISKCQICFPFVDYFALLAIDYFHTAGVWDIDENSLAVFFQFKGFGMSREFDRADLLAIRRVDDGDSAAAKPDINFFCGTVVSNVVGIILEVQFSNWLE